MNNPNNPIESRGSGSPFESLAAETGLSVSEIEGIAERGELRSFIRSNGLRPERRLTPRQAQLELRAKRQEMQPVSPRQALRELLGKRQP